MSGGQKTTLGVGSLLPRWILGIKLPDKCFYLMNHLDGPVSAFYKGQMESQRCNLTRATCPALVLTLEFLGHSLEVGVYRSPMAVERSQADIQLKVLV